MNKLSCLKVFFFFFRIKVQHIADATTWRIDQPQWLPVSSLVFHVVFRPSSFWFLSISVFCQFVFIMCFWISQPSAADCLIGVALTLHLLRDYGITIKSTFFNFEGLCWIFWCSAVGWSFAPCVKACNSAWHHSDCSPAAIGFKWLNRFLARCGRVSSAWCSYKTWTRCGHFEETLKHILNFVCWWVAELFDQCWLLRALNHVASSWWFWSSFRSRIWSFGG